tara:strand:+ start:11984 stop:12391 length:408 start_codon:yes stop_codon:yes gene_type:complete
MSIRNIPEEYLKFRKEDDYGFSAVDESSLQTTVNPDTLETEVIANSISTSNENISKLENKIDSIVNLYNKNKLGLDAERKQMEEEVASKLVKIEQLIMPLLVNLMKNPEKEYIYWPNRIEKLQDQVDKVLELTRD